MGVLLALFSLFSGVDIGVGSAVPLYPLNTRYPDRNHEIIAKVPFALPVVSAWFSHRYGLAFRYEGASFGSAFPSFTPEISLLFLYRENSITLGLGPFYGFTEVAPLPPDEAWKNRTFGLDFMLFVKRLRWWHSWYLSPWLRLGYINFLMTPRETDCMISGFNELRNLFCVDIGIDLAFPVLQKGQ